ncbi:hypothetical protein JH06_1972 [Blastocystis sp. subtype 4]|uniref:hypothetical protein n=1 Tax=Blastocystis sp. subtype 4 TaxID=944170 RepID=UPI0007118EEA|nr:hypothetical protein JH06_1972 [Blastocystis sp. subtype 4]KNB44317.1 hypothetical protein JH06_1972 [Blastocystis sp. subtype 4]|eukprot:XP_014527760.1 hypothetical protein JH06_1972 [Blastocystis sp. subtype 4]
MLTTFMRKLVYQGDHGIIRHLMSIMLVIYILHTLLIVPALAILLYDRKGESIFPSFKNRYTLFVVIAVFLVTLFVISIFATNQFHSSIDPVYLLLSESEVADYGFVLYLLVFIFIIGIPTFLMYLSIGMLSNPLSMLLSHKNANGPDLFNTGPIVQYVENEDKASDPEDYITSTEWAGISGVTLSSLQKSLVVEKTHEQTIVIKSEFSKGWVTRMIEGHPKINIQSFGTTGVLIMVYSCFLLICLLSGLYSRIRYGEWNYGLLVLDETQADTLFDRVLYLADEYHLDYIVFVLSFSCLCSWKGKSQLEFVCSWVQYPCFYYSLNPSSNPSYLRYLNTSAVTMLEFTFNNATAVILTLSVISIMAPQYTMFGTQTIGSDGTVCTLRTAAFHPIECELSSVASFLVAAEAQSVVFGYGEIIVCVLLILVVFVVALWPFISSYCIQILPYGISEFFETMNWTRFGSQKKDEGEIVVGDLF